MVILITGGPSADVYTDASKPPITGLDLLQQPVQQLQDAEVAVYAVGVHEGITDEKKTFGEQLKLIASEPKDDHMIKVGDYSNLADVASKIAKKACIGKSKGPDDKRSSYLHGCRPSRGGLGNHRFVIFFTGPVLRLYVNDTVH